MGNSKQRPHFDKKNSARAKGRQQKHVELDCESLLKTLQQERRVGKFNLVQDTCQPIDEE